jgi:transposase
MRRIGEVLRLKYELGLSESEIARGARLARSTVREYLDRAGASGLGYDEACGLADEELDRRLFAAPAIWTGRSRTGKSSRRSCAAAASR